MSTKNPTINELSETLRNVDALSQEGFDQIASIASLILSAMDGPDTFARTENIVNALKVIRGKAQTVRECINGEASDLGCGYIDEEMIKRYTAPPVSTQQPSH
ncbi:MAG: hypothetical protein PSX71_01775 [bacterium]|nr:hypothetical protein [bacterium]